MGVGEGSCRVGIRGTSNSGHGFSTSRQSELGGCGVLKPPDPNVGIGGVCVAVGVFVGRGVLEGGKSVGVGPPGV